MFIFIFSALGGYLQSPDKLYGHKLSSSLKLLSLKIIEKLLVRGYILK
jgi:hypothetical protein